MHLSIIDKAKSKLDTSEAASVFIKKTFELLEDKKFTDIVDWNAEGTAIVIKMPTEFGQKVLPTYFKHNNLASFVRQLNMYDFHKRRTQKYDHVYYHEYFHKNKKELLPKIKRKNHESALASLQKALRSFDTAQNNTKEGPGSNPYESQILKKLNKEALLRIASLEKKIEELTLQNQSLWNQLTQQNQKEDLIVSFLAKFMKTKGITLDQLPNVLKNQLNQTTNFKPDFNSASTKETSHRNHKNFSRSENLILSPNFNNLIYLNDISSNSREISLPLNLSKSQVGNQKYLAYNEACTSLYERSNSEFDKHEMQKVDYNLDQKCLIHADEVSANFHLNYQIKRQEAEMNWQGKRSHDLDREDLLKLQKRIKKDTVSAKDNPFVNSFVNINDGLELDMKITKIDSLTESTGNQFDFNIDLMNFN